MKKTNYTQLFLTGLFLLCVTNIQAQSNSAASAENNPQAKAIADAALNAINKKHQRKQTLSRNIVAAKTQPEIAKIKNIHQDSQQRWHVRMQQMHNGLPIFGKAAVVHFNKQAEPENITDGFIPGELKLSTTPTITAKQAIEYAIQAYGSAGSGDRKPEAELLILPYQKNNYLAYKVELHDLLSQTPAQPVIFIDAHSGKIIWQYNNLKYIRNRLTYDVQNGTDLPGVLVREEASTASGDAILDAAHDNTGLVYDYYFNTFGRDSYDDNGATIISSVHYRNNYGNAFWNGAQLVYGDGSGLASGPWTVTDIVAHEYTHALTDYSSGLIYSGESGGLNEAISDIFGAVVEAYRDGAVSANTWKVSEENRTPSVPDDALRYMNDPAQDGFSIDHYSDYSEGMSVHFSSGIANLAFYLLSEGGQHPRGKTVNHVAGIGIEAAAAIFYDANTFYLLPNSKFSQALVATKKAAIARFGEDSPQSNAVVAAWAAVGVGFPSEEFQIIATESGLNANQDEQLQFSYPSNGAGVLRFTLSGGTGEADLYVRYDSPATLSDFDCRPYFYGNEESCEFNPAADGTYHVMIHAAPEFADVTLTVEAAYPDPDGDLDGDTLANAVDNCPIIANADQANLDNDEFGDACDNDIDGDQIPNYWEFANKLDLYDPTDAVTDIDGDNLTNLKEYQTGTNPNQVDSDGDSIDDGSEIATGTDPLDGSDFPDKVVVVVDRQYIFRGDSGEAIYFTYPSNGAVAMKFDISFGAGIAGLFVKQDADPTRIDYDCYWYTGKAEEACIMSPAAGTYHIMIYGSSEFADLTLTVQASHRADGDVDNDSIANGMDNCPGVANIDQADLDGDQYGDVCDTDIDGDGLIEIYNLVQLNDIRRNLDGSALFGDNAGCPPRGCNGFELTTDLDFDTNADGIINRKDIWWNGGRGWKAIGTRNRPFTAIFAGNGHQIRNLYVNQPDRNYQGLFGYIQNATIREVGVTGQLSEIIAKNAAGGLIGGASNSNIIASYATAKVAAMARYAGGLVGLAENNSSITASFAGGTVTAATNFAGGLIGYHATGSRLSASFATAYVSAGTAGGLTGRAATDSHIYDSYWAIDTSGQSSNLRGGVGVLLSELQCPVTADDLSCTDSILYAGWSNYLDDTGMPYWDFGSNTQLPGLNIGGQIIRDSDGDGALDTANVFPSNPAS